jgi:hypothetical protein
VYDQNRKIKRRLTIMIIGGYLRVLIIVLPIILAIIYLPPILKPLFQQYNDILGGLGGVKSGTTGQLQFDKVLNNVSPSQLQEIMKMLGR